VITSCFVFYVAAAFTLNHQTDLVTVRMKLGSVVEFTIIEPSVLFVPSVEVVTYFSTPHLLQ